MNYAAAYQVIADAHRNGWTCERVASELQALGFTDRQIAKVMNTTNIFSSYPKGKPAPVTLAI